MSDTLLSARSLLDKKVFTRRKGKQEDANRRIGKVRRFVFHPNEKRVIGFIVKRPDVALMFHRSDLFVAIDRMTPIEEGVLVDLSDDAVDRKACERLGVEWAKCLLWLGMDVVAEDGERLGRVGDIAFEPTTGRVASIRRDEGAAARWLLGVEEIPADMIRGFRFGAGSRMADYRAGESGGGELEEDEAPAEDAGNLGAIVVANEVRDLDPRGGLAEKAGAASVRVAHKGKDALAKAKEQGSDLASRARDAAREKAGVQPGELGEKAGEAINKGAFVTGRQIGRAKGMFADFVDEYRKARDGGE